MTIVEGGAGGFEDVADVGERLAALGLQPAGDHLARLGDHNNRPADVERIICPHSLTERQSSLQEGLRSDDSY